VAIVLRDFRSSRGRGMLSPMESSHAETTQLVALMLIGTGAVATGIVGLMLPVGERLAAATLALVLGAGAGIASLAIGMLAIDGDSDQAYADVFLVASAIGLGAVLASLAVAWRRRVRT
jgi:hypothetical protein